MCSITFPCHSGPLPRMALLPRAELGGQDGAASLYSYATLPLRIIGFPISKLSWRLFISNATMATSRPAAASGNGPTQCSHLWGRDRHES